MALRELITLLGFKVDTGGLEKYNQSLDLTKKKAEAASEATNKLGAAASKVTDFASKLGGLFGLSLGIKSAEQLTETMWEFASEVINSGKEMNRLNKQIELAARSGDDVVAIQSGIFDIAQKTGREYNEIAETFKGFLMDSRDSKISQEGLLKATENLTKGFKVNKTSIEERNQAMSSIGRIMRLGKANVMSLGLLIDVPGMMSMLQKASGKNKEQLEAMAKAGKLTGETLIKWFSKPNEELDKQFDHLGLSVKDAMQRIRNELAKASGYIWKMTAGFSYLGNIIWWTFSKLSSAVQWFVKELGGLQSALEIIGYGFAFIFGPAMLAGAVTLLSTIIAMVAPWAAIGLAIVGVGLALQDLIMWMTDPTSSTVMGDLVGSFDDFKKKIEDFPLVKLFSGIKKMFEGDFGGGFTQIKESLGSVDSVVTILLTSVGMVTAAFAVWEGLKFTGLISAITGLGRTLLGLKTTAKETGAAVEAIEGAKGTKTAAIGGKTGKTEPSNALPGPRAAPPVRSRSIMTALSLFGIAADLINDPVVFNQEQWDKNKKDQGPWAEDSPAARLWKSIGDKAGDIWNSRKKAMEEYRTNNFEVSSDMGVRPVSEEDQIAFYKDQVKGAAPPEPATVPMPDVAEVSQFFNDLIKLKLNFSDWDTSKGGPGVGGGAPVINAGGITSNPTINVTAQMNEEQVAAAVRNAMSSTMPTFLDQISRTISDSIPKTEKATQ